MKATPGLCLGVLVSWTVLCWGSFATGEAASGKVERWKEPPIPCASARAVSLGRDLDGDGDPDEIDIHLEVVEVQEEVYPGQFETFWVFAPEGAGMCSPARVPSPTIRVEEGDHVRVHAPQHALLAAHDPLPRDDPAERHGRRARDHPGARDARADVHLRVRRARARDLLVPLSRASPTSTC